MATTCIPLPLLSISKPKPPLYSLNTPGFLAPPLLASPLSLSKPLPPSRRARIQHPQTQIWRILAATGEALPPDSAPLEASEQIVSSTDDGSGKIISVLLFLAFIALSVLTIGVIYLGVTDFLQKRASDKFEKEEAAKKKKGGSKKKKVKARAGPRGFGAKIDEDEDDDDVVED